MKKRLTALLLILIMALPAATARAAGPVGSSAGLRNFKVINVYATGLFRDVDTTAWYAMEVQACYEYGLIGGVSDGAFAPGKPLTAAEAVKLAACLHSIYHTGKADFKPGKTWYQTYVDYALKKGIIAGRPADGATPVTRAEFAGMLAKALPEEAFPAVSQVKDNAIPDVAMSDGYAREIYLLYRAGVLTGCDVFGTFRPQAPLSRAEAAVIAARASDAGFRQTLTLPPVLSGEELYERCAPAVFYLERYDTEGILIGIGSGFFISRDGLAVTNYHVISDASSAVITTADGRQYAVKGICGYDTTKDIAVLKIDGGGFPYLSLADSDQLEVGAHVYAIGSPLGLVNSFSDGIVSNVLQHVNGSDFIQYSAPISMGSGGGPVLNKRGEVVGVTCLTMLSGQTLNFAVPINALKDLPVTDSVPLISILAKNNGVMYYRGYYPVPDYGVYTGTAVYRTQLDISTGVKTYYYKLGDITVPEDAAVKGYVDLLAQHGFEWQSSYANESGNRSDVYYNEAFDMSVHFGVDTLGDVVCRVVAIY